MARSLRHASPRHEPVRFAFRPRTCRLASNAPTCSGPKESEALVLTAEPRCNAVRATAGTLVGHADAGAAVEECGRRPVRGGTMVRARPPHRLGPADGRDCRGARAGGERLWSRQRPAPPASFKTPSWTCWSKSNGDRAAGAADSAFWCGAAARDGEPGRDAFPPAARRAGSSFAVPASLPAGPYSFAVQAETQTTSGGASWRSQHSRTRLPFRSRSGPHSCLHRPSHAKEDCPRPGDARASTRLRTTARIHRQDSTGLAAPGVRGRHSRSWRHVHRADRKSGDIQVIATGNAAVGQLVFLRLDDIGTVEDQPTYRGSQVPGTGDYGMRGMNSRIKVSGRRQR